MTRQEAIKVLSILKAAYPNSYKGLSKEEANGTINIWATQFANIPFNVVAIAINKIISTNTFPPSIGEVKEKIRGLYWEAWEMLNSHYRGNAQLDDKTVAALEQIMTIVEPMRTMQSIEPSLGELLTGYNAYLTNDSKLLNGGDQ